LWEIVARIPEGKKTNKTKKRKKGKEKKRGQATFLAASVVFGAWMIGQAWLRSSIVLKACGRIGNVREKQVGTYKK
jgi:hypothetical protein